MSAADTDCMSWISVSVDSASSTGRVIVRSISPGVDPGYGRVISRNGASMSGMYSSGKRNAASRPITVIETKNITAVTGRLRLSSARVI